MFDKFVSVEFVWWFVIWFPCQCGPRCLEEASPLPIYGYIWVGCMYWRNLSFNVVLVLIFAYFWPHLYFPSPRSRVSPPKAPSQYPDNLKTVVGSMYWIRHRSMLNSGLRTNQLLLVYVIWKVLFCCYLYSQYQIKLFCFLASLWFVAIRTRSSANTKTVTFPFLKLMFSVVLSSLLMAKSKMRLKGSRDSGPPCLLPLSQQVHCQRLPLFT